MSISQASQAAFDPRVLAAVCFFATDIHSATLGKGKDDNTLARVRKGDLTGKGEVVVSKFRFLSISILQRRYLCR
jgi:hypothetical protein